MSWSLAHLLLAAAITPQAHPSVLIAVEPGVEAYTTALDGLTAALGQTAFRVIQLGPGTDLRQAIGMRDVQLVVAIGGHALAEVQLQKTTVPVVGTMLVQTASDQEGSRVEIDIPLSQQLELIRQLWPRHGRAGIICNPARSRYSTATLEAQARKVGFAAIVVNCDGPARLLRAVTELRGKVDFLICFPDPDLFNPLTIKPLVLAAIEARMPIVGYSPAFVRAGAAVGLYADYREIGRQTGEMVLRRLRGEDRNAIEIPRKIQVAVNERVARLLGTEFKTSSLPVEILR